MEVILVRAVVAIVLVWLGEKLVAAFELSAPANKIITVVMVILAILWVLLGTLVIV